MKLDVIDLRILDDLQKDRALSKVALVLMTGDSDYLIRVAVTDIPALEQFILDQLTPISGVEKIRSSFALKQVRYKTALPLPSLK